MSSRSALALSAFIALASLAAGTTGCHEPNNGGGLFSYTGGPTTIQSTEMRQSTVRMVDMRSGEVFFTMDVPVGKQLTFDFDRGDGDDAAYTPDLMRYQVDPIGDKMGKLHSAMTVPNAACRRVDVYVKQGAQYANQPAGAASMRTDQPGDRPDWWTPKGGPVPADKSHAVYDN